MMAIGFFGIIAILSSFCNAYDVELEIAHLKQISGSMNVSSQPFLRSNANLFSCSEERKGYTSDENLQEGTYCDVHLGCFPTDGVWTERGLFNFEPNSRGTINTQFKLFTRRNPTVDQLLVSDNPKTIKKSEFDGRKPTKFVVHGFLSSAETSWFQPMNRELLLHGDFNVINVDWGGFGASKTLYTQATANTRVVAAEIAYLIRTLQKVKGLNTADVHIIGHSLGAHIAGYVGANVMGLGRISGLDPAGPFFQGYDPAIRLDKSDAEFVDVIHSDGDSALEILIGGGFGSADISGHADFFPNGGKDQPNCVHIITAYDEAEDNIFKNLRFMSCDHSRAVQYFINSINSCPFVGVDCKNFRNFLHAKCNIQCSSKDLCNKMGFHAHKPQSGSKKYYLSTTGQGTFCAKPHKVAISVHSKIPEVEGSIQLTFHGSTKETQDVHLANGESLLMNGGQTYEYIAGISNSLGSITSLKVQWEEDLEWWKVVSAACRFTGFCSPTLKIHEIVLTDAENKRAYFCGSGIKISSGEISAHLHYSSDSCK